MARPANPNLGQMLRDAARAEFAERGLRAVRVEDVTQRAGVAKGSFYMHYESKEQLYEAIARDFLDEVAARLLGFRECACRGVGAEQMRAMIAMDVAFSDFLWENRDALRMVLEGAAGTSHAYLSDALVELFAQHMRAVMLDPSFVDQGAHPALDPDLVSDIVTGAVVMFARRILREGSRPDFRRWSTQLHRVLAGGLFTPEVGGGLIACLDEIARDETFDQVRSAI
ncbi:MAG: hypothetical protein AMXMBFR64_38370 [Myxococcales bacterium]